MSSTRVEPNGHPYAIKTASSALLSRSGSSSGSPYTRQNSHHYIPPPSPSPTGSATEAYVFPPSPTKPRYDAVDKPSRQPRKHRYSKSLTDSSPRPLPVPPEFESASPTKPTFDKPGRYDSQAGDGHDLETDWTRSIRSRTTSQSSLSAASTDDHAKRTLDFRGRFETGRMQGGNDGDNESSTAISEWTRRIRSRTSSMSSQSSASASENEDENVFGHEARRGRKGQDTTPKTGHGKVRSMIASLERSSGSESEHEQEYDRDRSQSRHRGYNELKRGSVDFLASQFSGSPSLRQFTPQHTSNSARNKDNQRSTTKPLPKRGRVQDLFGFEQPAKVPSPEPVFAGRMVAVLEDGTRAVTAEEEEDEDTLKGKGGSPKKNRSPERTHPSESRRSPRKTNSPSYGRRSQRQSRQLLDNLDGRYSPENRHQQERGQGLGIQPLPRLLPLPPPQPQPLHTVSSPVHTGNLTSPIIGLPFSALPTGRTVLSPMATGHSGRLLPIPPMTTGVISEHDSLRHASPSYPAHSFSHIQDHPLNSIPLHEAPQPELHHPRPRRALEKDKDQLERVVDGVTPDEEEMTMEELIRAEGASPSAYGAAAWEMEVQTWDTVKHVGDVESPECGVQQKDADVSDEFGIVARSPHVSRRVHRSSKPRVYDFREYADSPVLDADTTVVAVSSPLASPGVARLPAQPRRIESSSSTGSNETDGSSSGMNDSIGSLGSASSFTSVDSVGALRRREEELKMREGDVGQREIAVAEREVDVVRREVDVSRREDDILRMEDEVSERVVGLSRREEEVDIKEAGLVERGRLFEVWDETLNARQVQLVVSEERLAIRLNDLAIREAALNARGNAAQDRERSLDRRAESIDERERSLESKEKEFGARSEALSRLEQDLSQREDKLRTQTQAQHIASASESPPLTVYHTPSSSFMLSTPPLTPLPVTSSLPLLPLAPPTIVGRVKSIVRFEGGDVRRCLEDVAGWVYACVGGGVRSLVPTHQGQTHQDRGEGEEEEDKGVVNRRTAGFGLVRQPRRAAFEAGLCAVAIVVLARLVLGRRGGLLGRGV